MVKKGTLGMVKVMHSNVTDTNSLTGKGIPDDA